MLVGPPLRQMLGTSTHFAVLADEEHDAHEEDADPSTVMAKDKKNSYSI